MSYPHLAIFDDVFVTENVHSGEAVDVDQRRNLYRVVIGADGVRLAEEDTSLARKSRDKTGEITTSAAAIKPHVPEGMSRDAFLALAADPEIDARIAEQDRTVKAVRQAQEINNRPLLSELPVPSLPDDFVALLGRTIDHIARDAESRVAKHLADHAMEADGGNWIAERLENAEGESCPFCGQDIKGLPLIAAYRSVFSDRYTDLRNEISAMRSQITERFGDAMIGRLDTCVERNRGAADFWRQFCAFDPNPLTVPDSVPHAIRALRQAALALLERKEQAPLEPIDLDTTFNSAAETFVVAQSRVQEITNSIRAVNALITAKKHETQTVDVRAAEAALIHRRAIKSRYTDHVASLCTNHIRLTDQKEQIERGKRRVREQLNAHTRSVVKPYEQRINCYLDAFNADFRITEFRHHFPSGIAATTFRLVINQTAIDLGNNETLPDQPSFKNTLSSGDRSTLALAFFLAHLEQDGDLEKKTVVFDDPFGSQDAFRRSQTIHKITKIARNCAQVIVLSHDATFLKQIWDKAPAAERIALTIADHRARGAKIKTLDLERACRGRTAADRDDLQTYLNTGAGEPLNLIRKLRAVLETHCWTTYPECFQADADWLGDIVRKIREGGEQHLAHDLYDELDQINDYTKAYHHGEEVDDVAPDQIDAQDLTGYVKRTLRITNALQA